MVPRTVRASSGVFHLHGDSTGQHEGLASGAVFLCELMVFSATHNPVIKTSSLCGLPWLQLNERSPSFRE